MLRSTTAALIATLFFAGCSSSEVRRDPSAAPQNAVYTARRISDIDPAFYKNASAAELDAITGLVKDLARKVLVVEKEFLLFHYAPDTQIKTRDALPKASDPSVWDYFRSKSNKFLSNVDNGLTAANGLYFAVDPVSTYGYGGSSSFMLVVVRPTRGTRILDTQNLTNDISPETWKKLSELGCRRSVYANFGQSQQCQKYLKLSMRALEIGLVEYYYPNSVGGCENRPTAFVAIDPNLFSPNQVRLLMPKMDYTDKSTLQLMRRIYGLAAIYGSGNILYSLFPEWAKVLGDSDGTLAKVDATEAQAVKNENTYNCPNVSAHARSLEPLSESAIAGAAGEAVHWIGINEKLSAKAVYCGAPLISVVDVIPCKTMRKSKTTSFAAGAIRAFCDGGRSCSYDLQYFQYDNGMCNPQSDKHKRCKGKIEIKWQCLPGGDAPETYSKVFDLEEDTHFEIACELDAPADCVPATYRLHKPATFPPADSIRQRPVPKSLKPR
jgi:hypothetical protein